MPFQPKPQDRLPHLRYGAAFEQPDAVVGPGLFLIEPDHPQNPGVRKRSKQFVNRRTRRLSLR